MPTAQEIADKALELTAAAVDELAAFVDVDTDRELRHAAMRCLRPPDEYEPTTERGVWERHGAHQLLMSLGCIVRDADDDGGDELAKAQHDAQLALQRGDLAAADAAATLLVEGGRQHDAHHVHIGRILRGWIQLRGGEIDGAADELAASAIGDHDAVLTSFGPDLSLAWELLKLGREDEALAYFRRVSEFWSPSGPATVYEHD